MKVRSRRAVNHDDVTPLLGPERVMNSLRVGPSGELFVHSDRTMTGTWESLAKSRMRWRIGRQS
jgi:hypothetical protein